MRIGDVAFVSVVALERLNHPADGHAGEEPEPLEKRSCLRGIRRTFEVLQPHHIVGPGDEIRRLRPSLTDDERARWSRRDSLRCAVR